MSLAQFLTPGLLQVETAAGVPLNGAKLHVYAVSTTTPLALFSDEGLTTPATNPLVADSSGAFPAAFLAETKAKIVLATSADVTVWTREAVYTIGVADAVPASGVSYDGSTSGLASDDVQSAIDEVVELQGLTQQWETASDGVVATGTSTNAGAGGGPNMDLYRNSESQAASDVIGGVQLTGNNAVGSKTTYAEVRAVIVDASNGSEDGKIVLRTTIAGALADRIHVGGGIWGEGTTGGDPGAGKANFSEVQQSGVAIRPLIAATSQVTTSGTAFDFTGIPSWAKRVTVLFAGVSLSGSEDFLVQIGDSGGIETTGYVSDGSSLSATSASTSGFVIRGASLLSGTMTIEVLTGNQWVSSHCGAGSGSTSRHGGGHKSLSDTLDRVRITRSGTNTFSAGAVNVHYE